MQIQQREMQLKINRWIVPATETGNGSSRAITKDGETVPSWWKGDDHASATSLAAIQSLGRQVKQSK